MSFRGTRSSNDIDWIEALLTIPIPNGIHKVITSILAPYLVNVKGLEVSKAEKIIEEWVEKCERYEEIKGNIGAFVRRECLNAYRLNKKPKDLNYLRDRHSSLYREIMTRATSYEIEME
jgi:hypothetical protein